MATVRSVERQIQRVEGFEVKMRFAGPGRVKGRDVRSDRTTVPGYPYWRRRADAHSVADWVVGRFHRTYSGFEVDVLDARGRPVHGRTLLRTFVPATTEAEVRAAARRSASAAATRGFTTEPDANWLLRRSLVAALRTIVRSRHAAADKLVKEWVPEGAEACAFSLDRLPTDRPAERILLDETYGEIDDWFDLVIPLADEPEAVRLWRRLGIGMTAALDGTTARQRSVMVSRLTLQQRDRWFFYWSGGYQDGVYELGSVLPADRTTRRRELLGWVESVLEEIGELQRLEIRADGQTFDAAVHLVADRSPDTEIVRHGS